MRRYVLTLALVLAACGPGVYTRAEVVYAEPAQYVYVEPVDRVVVVTREVLVARGYRVYRVEDDGPTRVIWARRGDEEVVRVFATREGERVLVRGMSERRSSAERRWAPRRSLAPRRLIADRRAKGTPLLA